MLHERRLGLGEACSESPFSFARPLQRLDEDLRAIVDRQLERLQEPAGRLRRRLLSPSLFPLRRARAGTLRRARVHDRAIIARARIAPETDSTGDQTDTPGSAAEPQPSAQSERPTTAELLERLQGEIGGVLESSAYEHVISESPHQETGGGYQTVRLGDHVRPGFRVDRPNLLSGVELENRTACDLGANLGEISRELRRRGASQVDAYEYDPLFTQLARYITAYNGLSDINHFQADVSEQGFLRREYDVCVGLSAYSFMRHNIDYICSQVSEQLIIETHRIKDERWTKVYVDPIKRHLPHWCCFGVVTHGATSTDQRRLWLAFSRQDMSRFYGERAREVVDDAEGVTWIDLDRSTLGYLDKAKIVFEGTDDPLSKRRLRGYRRRLRVHEERFRANEQVNLAMSGEAYWLALMCGLGQFVADDGLAESNIYIRWMRRGIAAGIIDPGLRPLLDQPDQLRERASLRLTAMAAALRERDPGVFDELLIAYNPTPSHPSLERFKARQFAVLDSSERLFVPMLDGHHRLFVLKLLGVSKFPVITIWDPGLLKISRGARPIANYEKRIYQYLAGVDVDDPVLVERESAPAAAAGSPS